MHSNLNNYILNFQMLFKLILVYLFILYFYHSTQSNLRILHKKNSVRNLRFPNVLLLPLNYINNIEVFIDFTY